MGNITGRIFRLTTYGESHGPAIGGVIDGCPSRLELTEEVIQKQLDRRKPGQSRLTTPRNEADKVKILSGTENGVTLGTPIAFVIENTNRKPGDYKDIAEIPRPSHADYTYRVKYGIGASSGGGRASARETAARVAAGAVAEKLLADRNNIEIVAWVSSVGDLTVDSAPVNDITRRAVDDTDVRTSDPSAAADMAALIDKAAEEGDSLGGVITCVCRNVPAGIGEPVFEKLEARLASGMLSIPACKGFDIGSGFAGAALRGSENNDMYRMKDDGSLGTVTNRSGGVQGGISNGEPIVFRAAFKPTATIRKPQQTVDYAGNDVLFELKKGRHDPCVLPRAVPVVESMAALVLADMVLIAGK